ncbi:nucleoside triphosphatase YtkD [Halobacillus yeomjeoni]|uniref:Nucleoside triphosphatase YtkD n=1 Tax=Halobacillus yeomjeoni TaxID=311194 RepID=A0A931HWH9_9BACI|nr:nucleoside triphosphatase YtkD [Halobacillus yeomjeoni]MBH0231082.1 nucleoside triphosphatase YtkD [Halobacillus yeomjeoni]MCA0984473.1 nucleoside triphosphatase YtkD [Halobacillus yeomjeoni]
MKTFYDFYQNPVQLSFDDHPFSKDPKHVWIICRYKGQWLLTKHKDRGLEFPGGKVESGETAEEAAIREVKEETGADVEELRYIGQYHVEGKGGTVIKNVYFAEIAELVEQDHYFETDGPVLFSHLPKGLANNNRFSFMMKDEVLPLCMERIEQHN